MTVRNSSIAAYRRVSDVARELAVSNQQARKLLAAAGADIYIPSPRIVLVKAADADRLIENSRVPSAQ